MRRLETLACALAVAALTCVPLLAQENTARQRTDRAAERGGTSQLDGRTRGANIRVSKLIGMNIQNPQGKSVGKINDLVFDASTGKIRYAAVTFGGFLGIGNKMFVVPFEAFKIQTDPNDVKSTVLILDVTQQQLDGSVGFDESSWPDFADQNMTLELDKRYKINRNLRQRNGQVDIQVDRSEVDVDVNANRNDK